VPRWFVAWGPALLWCVVIFGLSAIPGAALPESTPEGTDKLVHALVYGVLGALSWRGARLARPHHSQARVIAVAALIATLYGITDELHQAFVPRRTPDWQDGVADTAGGLVGALICAAFVARRARGARQAPAAEPGAAPAQETRAVDS
jgi:VanZ family protein